MRRVWSFLAGAAMIVAGAIQPGQAQTPPAPTQPAPARADSGPGYYVVTYFDVVPAGVRKTVGLLRPFAATTRREDGNAELTVLHEIGRPGRFAIIEAWRDKAAFEAHGPTMKTLGDKLQPVFAAPFDPRRFEPFAVGPAAKAPEGGAIYVVTHVDVFPAGKDEAAGLIKELAADSRKDLGMLRFDAVIMEGRPNHFHLLEAWGDKSLREAHAVAQHTREFRAKVQPLEGALYDERLYEIVRNTN